VIRIILKTISHNEELQFHDEYYRTLDITNRELENILLQGGWGNGGYERTRVIGVEVISKDDGEKK